MWEVMAEFGAVTTPKAQRRTILGSIAQFEKRLMQAQAELSRFNARLALFEVSGGKRLTDKRRCADLIRDAAGLGAWRAEVELSLEMTSKARVTTGRGPPRP